ncbi:MAG: hypothetical protein HY690_04085 [Chloroflexi bacterium]|nr:hypothetical protein [Chloroflexota bacterium]
MRFTVVDRQGKVSFVAPCYALEALVAACSFQPKSLEELLRCSAPFSGDLPEHVLSGLAVFDEHNSGANFRAIHAALDYCKPQELPVFRVVDERTQEASLQPVRAGVVLFNLREKRIVQIHNTYAEIKRKGRVRIVEGKLPTNRVQRYELPPDWTLVPST